MTRKASRTTKTPKKKSPVAAPPAKLPKKGCDIKTAIRAIIALLDQGERYEPALKRYGLFWKDVHTELANDKALKAEWDDANGIRQEWWKMLLDETAALLALGKIVEPEVTSKGEVVYLARVAQNVLLRLYDQVHPKPKDNDDESTASFLSLLQKVADSKPVKRSQDKAQDSA